MSQNEDQEQELYHSEGMQSLKEAARRMREFADRLEQGHLTLNQTQVTIPEYVALKIELEEEHNGDIAPINFEIEVEITFPLSMRND